MNLFEELKRRNVIRVGLFYILSAWVVVQVAETVLPMFEVPAAALRVIVVILVLGFPLALVFAWVFEMTPEGIKRETHASVDPRNLLILFGRYEMRPTTNIFWQPLFSGYRASAQFKEVMKERGILNYWRETGFPDICRPIGEDDFECE